MATSTVLRVKRRLEDNPQDALVIVCKKLKKEAEEISPSLFVFRGTVESQDTCVKSVLPKSDLKHKPTHNVKDLINKLRKEKKELSADNRYEVVNCMRGLKAIQENEKSYDLIDLQYKQSDCEDTDVQYAYDLYSSTKTDFDVSMLDNLISIEDYKTDLIYGSYRENGEDSSSEEADDNDDSNEENNWRNDYPDSEPSSIDEEDMIKAMEKCDIDDLSSDSGEDKIYDNAPDPFKDDAKMYGAAYAKYKSRTLKEHPDLGDPKSLIHSKEMSDNESYKDDSDDGFYYGQEEDAEHFKEQYKSDDSSDG